MEILEKDNLAMALAYWIMEDPTKFVISLRNQPKKFCEILSALLDKEVYDVFLYQMDLEKERIILIMEEESSKYSMVHLVLEGIQSKMEENKTELRH